MARNAADDTMEVKDSNVGVITVVIATIAVVVVNIIIVGVSYLLKKDLTNISGVLTKSEPCV